MKALVAVLPGDGIGPEVTAQAKRALQAVATSFGHDFELVEAPFGGCSIDQTGQPLPQSTLDLCRRADAVLLGAVGGPKWDPPAKVRPEQGLLALRHQLGLYANLRPIRPHPELLFASPLKEELVRDVDLVVVRELTGGIYFGKRTREPSRASDECVYTSAEIERVVRVAGRLSRSRTRRLASVDKANVLETSRLWREVASRLIGEEFPDVALEHVLVDACAMRLVQKPASFDVIVTENMFGDILTDEASVLTGSIGMAPSASLGDGHLGLYEPIHGSAPDIAGRDIANPYGAILSVAMLLRHSLRLEPEASAVEKAVARAISHKVLTTDLAPRHPVSTATAGDAVVKALLSRE